ncbi:acetyl-CoA hydrolase/transferase family protein [Desulfoluna spongiiphila]|uniref:acetyl-CoA hydrolase/transferase family protein n=1 Tax=Desulfoluna spongiiphila TaxID=419481 RepID=UPI0012599472|nr:acetyl-CoA hydrolase/transferase C-terminal domain-containing protein [Desulfoluna spongiiphila]VVS91129.1 nagb/rpia transferase-like [Desulfoluna spongiiphila]
MSWKKIYEKRLMSPEAIAAALPKEPTIFASPAASFPLELINTITAAPTTGTVTMYSAMIMTQPDFLSPEQRGRLHYRCCFMGPLERMLLDRKGDITPFSVTFSRIHELVRHIGFDATILEVSPPDEHGYMSLGPSGTLLGYPALAASKKIYCQVNDQTPYIFGSQAHIHVSDVAGLCEVSRPCDELPATEPDAVDETIADLITARIPDGATLQLGIGKLADAIGDRLTDKKDLGIHTELLTPSMVRLHDMGVITGARKEVHPGKIISAFGMGAARDYRFMHKNPVFEMYPAHYVNDPAIIGAHSNFVSINNALAVDLTGQVSSESIGFQQHSATGGQLDFVRGARLSKGGQSFIAMKSTSGSGDRRFSRIQTCLLPGTAVTTPRSDVQSIVTEYGIAELDHKTIPERVTALIAVAHPDFREELAREAVQAGLISAEALKDSQLAA